jgi:hypothetical protein
MTSWKHIQMLNFLLLNYIVRMMFTRVLSTMFELEGDSWFALSLTNTFFTVFVDELQ